MVNARDARKIGVDTAMSMVVEAAAGFQKPVKHVAWENLTNATIWHYALRDTVNSYVGECPYRRAAAKGVSLAVMAYLQSWADGSKISPFRLGLYGVSQAAGEIVDERFISPRM